MPIIGGGGGGGSGVTATARRVLTAGNITTNSVAYAELAAATGGPGTGALDLTLAAAAGDVLMVGANFLCNSTTPNLNFDMATMVSGSPVNTVGQSALNAANDGITAWNSPASVIAPVGPPILYTVVSGDLSAGNVVLRLYYLSGSATGRAVLAATTAVFFIWATNLKH